MHLSKDWHLGFRTLRPLRMLRTPCGKDAGRILLHVFMAQSAALYPALPPARLSTLSCSPQSWNWTDDWAALDSPDYCVVLIL